MPKPPEQPPRTEAPRFPFLMASRFDSRETSQAPYDIIQAIVRHPHSAVSKTIFWILTIASITCFSALLREGLTRK